MLDPWIKPFFFLTMFCHWHVTKMFTSIVNHTLAYPALVEIVNMKPVGQFMCVTL